MAEQTTDAEKAAAEAAEAFAFRSLERALEAAGTPEAVLHLRHLLRARLVAVEPEGRIRRVRLQMQQRLSDYAVQIDAVSGEPTGWYFSALAADPGDAVPAEEALAAATRAAALPEGAALEHSGYEEQGEEPVFVARWAHREGGIPVERDYIQVLVNGATGRPFALSRRWHALDPKPSWR
jgi:hypothetical protein